MRRTAGIGLLLAALAAGGVGCSSGGGEELPPISRTYANPISLPDEWGEYGLGDPFVFKYNGYYYLYVSTRDTDVGVKVWRSPDLVDWTYEGLCTEEPATAAAYAPEVRYWNGKFYMYTSPAGQGHYVLVADKPTGPFELATDNFGRTIDGTTFVDDDGRWYFYYAGPQGIQSAPMADPLTVEGAGSLTGASMDGWTEGPTVFKRGDKYYMTYTGNHVFSAGYRVNGAASDSPLQGFRGFESNPVLLRSEGPTVGLGHNSVVRGPDLDSDYMIYHNLEGHGVVGPLRHMNVDRMVWNGERFAVLGPTTGDQPAPEPPAFEDRFERGELGGGWTLAGDGEGGGDGADVWSVSPDEGLSATAESDAGLAMLLAKPEAAADFTAEYHVRLMPAQGSAGAAAGIVFAYEGEDDYGVALIDPASGRITADIRRKGETAESAEAALPSDLDLSQLHELRAEKEGAELRFYVDDMRVLTMALKTGLGPGRIGYAVRAGEARFGYVAFSDKVGGSGVRTAYAPLPGRFDAVHAEPGSADDARVGGDGTSGYYLAGLTKKDSPSYRVNVAAEGEYAVSLRVRPGKDGVKLRLRDGDGKALTPVLEARPAKSPDEWAVATAGGIKLKAGAQRWRLDIVGGSTDFLSAEAEAYAPVTAATETFDDRTPAGWTRYEGVWSIKDGVLKASSVQPAKILWGDDGWTDYTFEADLTVPEDGGRAGLYVRATNPANGMELNQNRVDFLQGYYVYADAEGLHLAKLNYGTTELADASYPLPPSGEKLHLKVRAVGSRISAYVGDDAEPALSYDDLGAEPFLRGRVGFGALDTAARFDEASVAPATAEGGE